MAKPWWAWLDTRRLVLLVTMAAVFAMAARVPVDSDGWWHLASGRTIVERGSIPHEDPFSHTKAGTPWVDNGWLTQVGFYLLYRWLGYAGLGLLVAAMATTAMALVWLQMSARHSADFGPDRPPDCLPPTVRGRHCRQSASASAASDGAPSPLKPRHSDGAPSPLEPRPADGDPFVRAFVIVLAATVSGPVWTVRPHLATYVLTAALGYLIHLWQQGRQKVLWCIPPLFCLWVNLHAGYILGLALLALTCVGEALDRLCRPGRSSEKVRPWSGIARLTGMGALALVVVPLNPYGFKMWRYPFYNMGQQVARQHIAEWASPDFHRLVNQPFAALLLLTLLAVGLSNRRGRWAELLPVVGFAYLTLQSQRAMGLFALVTAPVLSRHVASLLSPHLSKRAASDAAVVTPRRAAINGALALLLMGAALVKAAAVWRGPTVEAAVRAVGFPVDGADWIAENEPPGELYNPYQWGGYLIWRLTPDYAGRTINVRVFVDGRADLYGDEFLLDYLRLAAATPDWDETLASWNVSTALVQKEGPLSEAMSRSADWDLAHEDQVAAVYVRTTDHRPRR